MNTRLLMMLHGTSRPAEHRRAARAQRCPLIGSDFEGPVCGTVCRAEARMALFEGTASPMDLRHARPTTALISMKSFGLRHGPPEVMAAIDAAKRSIPPPTTFAPRPGSRPHNFARS